MLDFLLHRGMIFFYLISLGSIQIKMSAPMLDIDKKCLAVRRVTDYFIKGNNVTDDTVIHSLFDSIKVNCKFCFNYRNFIEFHMFSRSKKINYFTHLNRNAKNQPYYTLL